MTITLQGYDIISKNGREEDSVWRGFWGGGGGGVGPSSSLALQNPCSIPADAPTFSFCQEDRRKRKKKIILLVPSQNEEWEESGENSSSI
ncbi:hypothetical protein INR49_001654 [Caranx melampygus]|nr:hypothetical protein INR49_001654 [Caranx melampygus]